MNLPQPDSGPDSKFNSPYCATSLAVYSRFFPPNIFVCFATSNSNIAFIKLLLKDDI
jgi:hypothetical protein